MYLYDRCFVTCQVLVFATCELEAQRSRNSHEVTDGDERLAGPLLKLLQEAWMIRSLYIYIYTYIFIYTHTHIFVETAWGRWRDDLPGCAGSV